MTSGFEPIRNWISNVREHSQLKLTRIDFDACRQWSYKNGGLHHASGRFFSIIGVEVGDVANAKHAHRLAMINQPEIGWLGFVIRCKSGQIEWLVQAKTEPGNINETHIAPTIQATRSNYQRAHGGRPTEFLELFSKGKTFLSDAPHSEQGTKFLWKFNRNSVLALPDGADLQTDGKDNWNWCNSAALRSLLSEDYCVNTDARSVIATAPWVLLAERDTLFNAPTLDASYRRSGANQSLAMLLKRIRPSSQAETSRWNRIHLEHLDGFKPNSAQSLEIAKGASVGCFEINVQGREVENWCQPFLLQHKQGEYTLFTRQTENGAEFFVRIYQDIGFANRKEYGPSLHSLFETPRAMRKWGSEDTSVELLRIMQSDEGGRFFKAAACYRVKLTTAVPSSAHYPFGQWVSLSTLERLTTQPGCTTNELRTLVSLLLSSEFDKVCSDV